MKRFVVAAALLFVLAFVPGGQASSPEPKLYILHDVPDDGYTYVGNLNSFGYVLHDADGTLSVHKNGVVEIDQNGLGLYKTTPDSGHDYDALNTFQIAFPTPGPYTVKGSIPISGSVNVEAEFHGNVSADPLTTTAKIDIEPKGPFMDGVPSEFVVKLTDEQGNLIPHSDALVEIRRPTDQWLLFRTHLHTHEEAMSFKFLFPSDGDYLVRAVGYMAYPEPDAPRFAPVAASKTVKIAPGALGMGSEGIPAKPGPMASTRYELQSSIDPQDSNTPFSRTVVSGLVYDKQEDRYVPHVNFEAWVDEPAGHTVFYSKSLHEYDGVYDFVLNLPYPSKYTLTLKATQGTWSGVLQKDFTIAEVVTGTPLITSAGGVVVTATGLEGLKSGAPSTITFASKNLAGVAAQHTEIDFEVLKAAWGPPLLQNKIHTHGSGMFQVDVLFPEAGNYLLVVDPVTIHGEPTPEYYFGSLGGKLVVPLTVAQGPPLPAIAPPPGAPLAAPPELPAPTAFLVLAAIAGLVLWRRNR